MRIVSFLFLFLTICIPAHCFTVILKNGKRIQGTLISEDEQSLQFKGQDGIFISFKKAALDFEAMENQNKSPEIAKSDPPLEHRNSISLVELARETKSNRTGRSRTLSDRDIAALPEVSVIGKADEPVLMANSPRVSPSDEKYWRKEAQVLKEKLAGARSRKDQAIEQCSRARNNLVHQPVRHRKGEVVVLQISAEPKECAQAEEKNEALQRLEQQWNDFCERARHADVPWQWIE
jgi:hypothetical protein